jgi:phosphatidylinositol alpha-mannosyltransferase
VPLSVDLKKYRRPKTRTSAAGTKILYIGRLERRKGVRYLLRAFQLLQAVEPDVELIIAGNGPERKMLEELSEELELHNVSFLGFVEDEQKHQLLNEADLFCSPAIYGEGFGIVLLEAMAKGLVTVAGDNIGYASALQELGAISLVDTRNTADFARRLRLLLKEERLRAAWQAWAATYVKQFSYEHVVDQYLEVYKAALKEHGHKHRVHA